MKLVRIAATLGVLLATAAPHRAAAEDANSQYLLGSGDRLQIHVSDFRSGLGEAYQWPMFSLPNQEFVVGPDGRLSVPVAGQIVAQGHSTAEIETEIATRLQARAGLTARPDVSAQIVRFRPVYVDGLVDKPGEYDFRPGLTVLQAVSLAGGLQRVSPELLMGLQKDALNARGDLRGLEADRISLVARQARIDAEKAGAETIAFPADIAETDPDAARARHEEQILFDARRNGLKRQIDALTENKKNLLNEIDRLRDKNAAVSRGIEATRKEYENIVGLVKRGLSAAPRELELEQNLAQLQSNQLDVEVAVVRAGEDIVKADREIAEINYHYGNELIQEAQDVRVKLAETVQKIVTDQQLLRQAEVTAPAQLQPTIDAARSPAYRILRTDGSGAHDTRATEMERLQPGDVVRVVYEPDAAAAPASGQADRN